MLKLFGFPVSNYTNMVQLALMEKGVPYEYVLTMPDQSAEFLAKSPRGKVPCLETPQGFLNETDVILEYLEDTQKDRPLLPADPYARARTRALMKEIELYIEWPARACYAEVFFGGKLPDAIKAKSRDELLAGFATLERHGKFTPYVAGDSFSLADIVFLYSVDLGAAVLQSLWGIDVLAKMPAAQALFKKLGENPNVRDIAARRDAAMSAFIAAAKARVQAAT